MTHYLKQRFSRDSTHQATKYCNLWEICNIWSETYDCSSFLPGEGFQVSVQKRGPQAKPSESSELRRWRWVSGEARCPESIGKSAREERVVHCKLWRSTGVPLQSTAEWITTCRWRSYLRRTKRIMEIIFEAHTRSEIVPVSKRHTWKTQNS